MGSTAGSPFRSVLILAASTWAFVGDPVGGLAQDPRGGSGPSPRAHHAMVYDAANRRVLLIGGSALVESTRRYQYFDDIWAFDGTRWALVGATGNSRSGQAVAFDGRLGRVLAFGGYCECRPTDSGRYPDLLALNGPRWEALGTTDRPTTDAAMVYDTRRDRMVLFGGSGGNRQTLDQTWEYGGAGWTPINVVGPGARGAFAMAYDERRGRTVLFGGFDTNARVLLGDTWEYDGTAWTRVATGGPSPRLGASMAYDARRGLAILFGGEDSETWAWDGTRWTRLAEEGPEPRLLGSLVYDSARDRVVLFGGRATRQFNDTWEWDGERWRQVTP